MGLPERERLTLPLYQSANSILIRRQRVVFVHFEADDRRKRYERETYLHSSTLITSGQKSGYQPCVQTSSVRILSVQVTNHAYTVLQTPDIKISGYQGIQISKHPDRLIMLLDASISGRPGNGVLLCPVPS